MTCCLPPWGPDCGRTGTVSSDSLDEASSVVSLSLLPNKTHTKVTGTCASHEWDSLVCAIRSSGRMVCILHTTGCQRAYGTCLLPASVLTVEKETSGYCVEEWLPQIVTPVLIRMDRMSSIEGGRENNGWMGGWIDTWKHTHIHTHMHACI